MQINRSSWKPDVNIRNIGNQLRIARKERGWSQTDLAEQAGISRPTVARAEAGEDISTANLSKIAEALELTVELEPTDKA